jgi:hypothetical protein
MEIQQQPPKSWNPTLVEMGRTWGQLAMGASVARHGFHLINSYPFSRQAPEQPLTRTGLEADQCQALGILEETARTHQDRQMEYNRTDRHRTRAQDLTNEATWLPDR